MKRLAMIGVAMLGLLAGLTWSQAELIDLGNSTTSQPFFTDIEAALAQDVKEITAEKQPLAVCFKYVRDTYRLNIAVNWPALEAAGVKRETLATFHLQKIPVEQVIRTLCEVVDAKGTRLNFVVGDGAVEITTNEQLASAPVTRLLDLTAPLKMQLMPGIAAPAVATSPPTTAKSPADEARDARAQKILAVLRAELARLGERAEGQDRELYIKRDTLVATQSRRAQLAIAHVLQAFAAPLKPGSVPPGVVASVRQKKAETEMLRLLKDQPEEKRALQTIAEKHENLSPELNLILLPAAQPAGDPPIPPRLDYLVNDAGIVLVGPAEAIRARTLFAVYDLRDLIKRLSLKPENKTATPAELSARITAILKKKVTPNLWSDLDKGPCSLTEYEGLLVVFAPPPVYRALGAAWKDAEK